MKNHNINQSTCLFVVAVVSLNPADENHCKHVKSINSPNLHIHQGPDEFKLYKEQYTSKI